MSKHFAYCVRSRSHLLSVTAACFLFVGNAQCQEKPLDDCCDIISIDGENMIVYARHMETGRVLQFGVDVLDIRSIRIGDMVGAAFSGDAAVVTRIAGADRHYETIIRPGNDILDVGGQISSDRLKRLEWPPSDIFRPRKIEECCTIISIDGENSIVYSRHVETGRVLQFGVDEVDIRSSRIGDLVGATFTDDSAVVTSIAGADRNYETIFRPRKLDECCTIISNPKLSGASGRVVVDALEGVASFHVEVFKAGTSERVKDWYGNASVDLLPGDYDITLNGVLVTGATVNRQMDTTIRCGALSVNLSDGSHWEVFNEAQETRFNDAYGTATIALPVGVYAVRVAGGWLRIEIEDGAVTTI